MTNIFQNKLHNLFKDKDLTDILNGSVWAFTAYLLTGGLTLISNIVIARFYGAGKLGIVATIESFLILVTIFTVLGTNTSVLRLIPEHMAKYSPTSAFRVYRKIHFMVISVSLITGALFFFGADLVATKIFSKPQLSFYFTLSSPFILFQSIYLLNSYAVRGLNLYKVFALMRAFPSICNLILLFLLTLFNFTPDAPVYAYLLSIALPGLAGWLIMESSFKDIIQTKDLVHETTIHSILSISLPMFMGYAMNLIIAQTGVIILNIFLSEAEVGYYAIAVKLANLSSITLMVVTSMAAPKFSKLFHSGHVEKLFYVARKSAKIVFWTSLPILLALVLLGRSILNYGFGNEFVIAYPAMMLLVLGQFISAISGSTGCFMNMTGNQIVLRNILFGAAIINIVLNFLFVPTLGIAGSALAGASSICFWNIYSLLYIKKKYGQIISYLPFLK